MGTKMAVTFTNIFIAEIKTGIIKESTSKPLSVISLWNTTREEITQFTEQTVTTPQLDLWLKYQKQIEKETTFLETTIYKDKRFNRESMLDVRTHLTPTETFQCMHFTSCHPTHVKRRLVKGEGLRLLRTNSFRLQGKPSLERLPNTQK